jgi:aryl-alcohol dehydrogenase-like predicted oxidoreductase
LEQLKDNIKAFEVRNVLTKEIQEKIEEILGNRPTSKMNWKTWQPFTPRR